MNRHLAAKLLIAVLILPVGMSSAWCGCLNASLAADIPDHATQAAGGCDQPMAHDEDHTGTGSACEAGHPGCMVDAGSGESMLSGKTEIPAPDFKFQPVLQANGFPEHPDLPPLLIPDRLDIPPVAATTLVALRILLLN